ncbi:RusA family crossover junction endodeoxyribonuclease [Psychrosphaera sp. 1_MG-2023]|uniref:RusA family crossover junction endodeoxyribonuclease n=1 Tax=Psychrosphaera sp. 1_MG-2023 TaxID=3062643 RepID=UPI0026E14FC0|nr:RusA family crossover junction endodeoxyribonuclease [Psychrosphaera sp. 1_MG-2023]MDO6718831.1 RusA family crossover junction endodeoxyribonuclease [Psychrosphaera sp. 1_MG-2023]
MITLNLPYPPTVNHYYGNAVGGRKFIKAPGRKYRNDVRIEVLSKRLDKKIEGPIKVSILAFVPDNRKRDLDNINKSLLDAMQHAGVYVDDTQIVDIRSVKKPVIKNGRVVVNIEPYAKTDTDELERKLGEVINVDDWERLYVFTPEAEFTQKLIELSIAYKI